MLKLFYSKDLRQAIHYYSIHRFSNNFHMCHCDQREQDLGALVYEAYIEIPHANESLQLGFGSWHGKVTDSSYLLFQSAYSVYIYSVVQEVQL